jgi:hypothetical protein
MPGFDRTGPLGAGPRTGRGRGACGGRAACGWGAGRGFFRGFGFGGNAPEEGLLGRLAALEEEVMRLRAGREKTENQGGKEE